MDSGRGADSPPAQPAVLAPCPQHSAPGSARPPSEVASASGRLAPADWLLPSGAALHHSAESWKGHPEPRPVTPSVDLGAHTGPCGGDGGSCDQQAHPGAGGVHLLDAFGGLQGPERNESAMDGWCGRSAGVQGCASGAGPQASRSPGREATPRASGARVGRRGAACAGPAGSGSWSRPAGRGTLWGRGGRSRRRCAEPHVDHAVRAHARGAPCSRPCRRWGTAQRRRRDEASGSTCSGPGPQAGAESPTRGRGGRGRPRVLAAASGTGLTRPLAQRLPLSKRILRSRPTGRVKRPSRMGTAFPRTGRC